MHSYHNIRDQFLFFNRKIHLSNCLVDINLNINYKELQNSTGNLCTPYYILFLIKTMAEYRILQIHTVTSESMIDTNI